MKSTILIAFIGILIVGCGGTRKFTEAEYGEKFAEYNKNKLDLRHVPQEDYLDIAVQELAKKLVKNIVERKLYNVAVFQFTDGRHQTSALGREIAEKLTGAIVQCDLPDSFNVVGRFEILSVDYIAETEQDRFDLPVRSPELVSVEQRGLIDASIRTAIRGQFREREKVFNINAAVIDIRTGKVYAASTVSVPKNTNMIWDATGDQYLWNLDHKKTR